MFFQSGQRFLFLHELVVDFGDAGLMVHTGGDFAAEDAQFGIEGLNAAAAIIDFRRHRVLADGDSGRSGVNQAYRLVR